MYSEIKITKDNLIVHELIGLKVKIVKSSHKGLEGIKGKVVNETQNTFMIETEHGEKSVPKKGTTFSFQTSSGPVNVQGTLLNYRPEDRTKKLWKTKGEING